MLTDRYDRALGYAAALHREQVRKGTGVPYLSHLLSVSALVIEDGGSEDEAIAGLLHDAIEDGPEFRSDGVAAIRREIREQFGEMVLSIVESCSDTDQLPKPPWRERKVRYLEHLRTAGPAVRRVTAADKLHNARSTLADYRSLGESLWGRFNTRSGGSGGQLWFYDGVVTALLAADGQDRLAQELLRTVNILKSEIERNQQSTRR
jgi:(p)ppGpp synthase/HD superfamily hydrolase